MRVRSPSCPDNRTRTPRNEHGKSEMTDRIHSETKRRIAILSPSLAGRGAERKALYIASGLLERGHEVDFLLQRLIVHYPGEVPSQARIFFSSERSDARTQENLGRISGVPRPLVAEPLPWRIRYPRVGISMQLRSSQLPLLMSTRLPRWASGVAAYLDRERPDALLAMNVLAVAAATMATHIAQRPLRTVATLHESLNRRRLLRRARCSYPYADSVVGVSHGVSTEFAKIAGLKCDHPQIIYNPVVSQSIECRSRDPANHPWLDNPDLPVILAIGKLNKSKNFPLLLAAFARLLARRRARLVVLGDGRMRPKLLALAKRLGIEESVDFPGFKETPSPSSRRPTCSSFRPRTRRSPPSSSKPWRAAVPWSAPIVPSDPVRSLKREDLAHWCPWVTRRRSQPRWSASWMPRRHATRCESERHCSASIGRWTATRHSCCRMTNEG